MAIDTTPKATDNRKTVLMKILVQWRSIYGITSTRTDPEVNPGTETHKSLKYKWLLAIFGG